MDEKVIGHFGNVPIFLWLDVEPHPPGVLHTVAFRPAVRPDGRWYFINDLGHSTREMGFTEGHP